MEVAGRAVNAGTAAGMRAAVNGGIRGWSLEKALRGHTEGVLGCAWSPDGTKLASASDDTTVRVWDVGAAREVAILQGHMNWAQMCAWSPDGLRLASASHDKTVRVWDVFSGREVSKLEGHGDLVWNCGWSPDGARLVSASGDKTVRVWDVSTGREVGPRGCCSPRHRLRETDASACMRRHQLSPWPPLYIEPITRETRVQSALDNWRAISAGP